MEMKSAAEINDIIQKRREQFKGVMVMRPDDRTVTIEVKGGVPEVYRIMYAAETADALVQARMRASGLSALASEPILSESEVRDLSVRSTAE